MRSLMTLTTLVAVWLFCARSATAVPRLPAEISQWAAASLKPSFGINYMLTLQSSKLKRLKKPLDFARFWDRSTLQHGKIVENYKQAYALLAKLNSGQPIIVAAFGDSITSAHDGFGGCSTWDLSEADAHRPGADTSYATCMPRPVMWLTTFMQQINATWPHHSHRLINLGKPGYSYRTYAEGECWEEHLPRKVDLVILEHLPYLEDSAKTVLQTERLLHRLWLHVQAEMPTVIMLTMMPALSPFVQAGPNTGQCILRPERCSSDCATDFADLPSQDMLNTTAEMSTHAVAAYYYLTSLSFTALVHSIMRDKLMQRKLGVSDCEAFALMFNDPVHPDAFGRLLMVDMLLDYLERAEAFFSDPQNKPSDGPVLPPVPLEQDSQTVFRGLCLYAAPFGNNATGINAAGSSATDRAATGNTAAGNTATGNTATGSAAAGNTATGSSSAAHHSAGLPFRHPLPVVRADGWVHVGIDGESQKHKPGLVATAPGSVLWIHIPVGIFQTSPSSSIRSPGSPSADDGPPGSSSEDDGPPGSSSEDDGSPGSSSEDEAHTPASGARQEAITMTLRLAYLRSYRHMGRGLVSCLEACSCSNITLEGHHTQRNSVPAVEQLTVTISDLSSRCIIEVKVLPGSSSGEHKVKVIHVAFGSMVNMSQQLQAIVAGSRNKSHGIN